MIRCPVCNDPVRVREYEYNGRTFRRFSATCGRDECIRQRKADGVRGAQVGRYGPDARAWKPELHRTNN